MAKSYVNFYENIKEAEIRLRHTCVLYDGKPYYVLAMDDHREDGVFRIYLDEMGHKNGMTFNNFYDIPYEVPMAPGQKRGKLMDDWMEKNPGHRIIRKKMNSPLFNKFRPFDLGMMNLGGRVIFIERQPTRNTQQGLTTQMLQQTEVSLSGSRPRRDGGGSMDLFSEPMTACITGQYPTIHQCIDNLKDDNCTNEGAAFHRKFAILRGPLNMLFLAYKDDVIGQLVNNDTSILRISNKFKHVKESVEELSVFNNVVVQGH